MESWLRIVECYPDFHNGPSVPFLFGAIQNPIGVRPRSEEAAKDGLRRLLSALRQAPKGHGIRIVSCGPTHAHVVTRNPFVRALIGSRSIRSECGRTQRAGRVGRVPRPPKGHGDCVVCGPSRGEGYGGNGHV